MEKKQESILIYGAGGQARVVVDIVERGGSHRILGLLEDRRTSAFFSIYFSSARGTVWKSERK